MEGAGADLHVVGLQDDAALVRPVVVQRQDQPLEGAARDACGRAAARYTEQASERSAEESARPSAGSRIRSVKSGVELSGERWP